MLSAALLTFASIKTIFLVDVVTAALAVSVLALFLHVPVHQKAADRSGIGYLDDLKEGLAYISHHGYVKKLFIFSAVFFILATPVSFLTPLQVTRSFGADVWRLTAIEVLFSIGMTAGGIILAYWGGFRNRIHSMTLSTLMIGGCTLALGLTPVFWIYLFFMALAGIAIPIFNTPFTVLLQERVEGDILGREFGVLGMITSVMMPLAMLLFGPLADMIAIEWLLIVSGILIFIEGLLLLRSKELIQAGEPVLQTVKKDL
jgi:DHA3 family macrolide efflux protein-like MFS transporter